MYIVIATICVVFLIVIAFVLNSWKNKMFMIMLEQGYTIDKGEETGV